MNAALHFDAVWASEPRGSAAPAKLNGVTGAFGSGIHLVIGELDDGIETLLAVASGRSAPRRGEVRLGEALPHRDASVRRRIGLLDVDASLPEGTKVSDALDHFRRWHPDAAEDLAPIGTPGSLHDLRIDLLTAGQRLQLAWRLALALAEPAVLLLHDPFRYGPEFLQSGPDEPAAADVLRTLSSRGTIVVITAPRAGSYFEIADAIYLLAAGQLHGGEPLRHAVRYGRLKVSLDPRVGGDARALAAALSEHEMVHGVQWSERMHEASVTIEVAQLEDGARLVAQLAASLGSAVTRMSPAVPTRRELEATIHAQRAQRAGTHG
ncbi:MAG: hypothetical protein VB934_04940 [Polyangiaceae bacterium]